MATGLTAGCIYILEAQDRGEVGDDFIVDHAGDPEDIDLDNYTEGTDYVYVSYIHKYNKFCNTGIPVTDLGAGSSVDLKLGKRGYLLNIMGEIDSFASAKNFDTFVMDDNHTEATNFKRYYFIYKRAADTYDTFIDGDGTAQEYCKGIITPNCSIGWMDASPQTWAVLFNFRSVW